MNEAVQALRAAADALEQKNVRIAELEAALKPFARAASEYDASVRWVYDDNDSSYETYFTVGDLRRARAALAPDKA